MCALFEEYIYSKYQDRWAKVVWNVRLMINSITAHLGDFSAEQTCGQNFQNKIPRLRALFPYLDICFKIMRTPGSYIRQKESEVLPITKKSQIKVMLLKYGDKYETMRLLFLW